MSEAGGRIVWHDLMTHDTTAARAFYAGLFGWSYKLMDFGAAGKYQMLFVGEDGIGGVVPLAPEHDMPSYWLPYATVANAEEAAARAPGAGGRVAQSATELPGLGRYAVVTDREGASLALWEAEGDDGPSPSSGPGCFCWSELMARDAREARAFYGEVLDWDSRQEDMGDLGLYTLFRSGETDVAGMKEMDPGDTGLPHWLTYVLVADTDATATKIGELGGRVLVGPEDIPGLGRFLVATDPTGAEFGAITFGG